MTETAKQFRFQRTVLKADVEGYDHQIAGLRSMIRVHEAQIATLEEYRRQAVNILAEMGGDDDD